MRCGLNPVEHPNASPVLARYYAARQGEAFENAVGLVGLRARMLRPLYLRGAEKAGRVKSIRPLIREIEM